MLFCRRFRGFLRGFLFRGIIYRLFPFGAVLRLICGCGGGFRSLSSGSSSFRRGSSCGCYRCTGSGVFVRFIIHGKQGIHIKGNILCVYLQTPAAENYFIAFEAESSGITIRNNAGNHIYHSSNLICNLFLQVRLDSRDFIAALACNILAGVLVGNQDNIFIVKVHQAFQRVQEFAPHLIPRTEGIIRFMGNTHLLIHIKAAMLIQIFQQVNNDCSEAVFLLFQFGNCVLEQLPSKRSFRLPPFNLHFILNADIRGINELDIAIRIQHKGIGEGVCKGGFPTKRHTINPKHTLFNGFNVPSLVFR